MTKPVHTHHCTECGRPYLCEGEQTPNYDGWPEVVCRMFHILAMSQCPACLAQMEDDDEPAADREALS
jgi:hypothetical protein